MPLPTNVAETAFERYVGVPASAFADSKKAILASAGSLANEKDYELVRDVYEAARRDGCAAAAARLEHLSYLSMLECVRNEKETTNGCWTGLCENRWLADDACREVLPVGVVEGDEHAAVADGLGGLILNRYVRSRRFYGKLPCEADTKRCRYRRNCRKDVVHMRLFLV